MSTTSKLAWQRLAASDPTTLVDARLQLHHALQVIVNTYLRHDCWLTYGSWVPNVEDGYVGQWPPYPEGTTDFRRHPHRATAVRTWKKWLWD